jgi:hypothetical protein
LLQACRGGYLVRGFLVSFLAFNETMSVCSVLTALDPSVKYHGALCAGKDLAFDLAKDFFAVDVVHLEV